MSIPQHFDKDQSASVSNNTSDITNRSRRAGLKGVFTAILAIAILTIPAIAIGQTYFGLDLVGHVAGSMMPAAEAAAPGKETRARSLSEYVFSFFSDQDKSRKAPAPSPFDPHEVATDSLAEPPSTESAKKAASSLVQLHVPSQYPNIQAAINAADPLGGDEIVVAPGTYIEQLIVNVSVTITGSGVGQTIIQSPPTLASSTVVGVSDTQSIVEVRAGRYVTMNDLTVSGPVEFDVSTYGVYVTESATLEMNNARVTAIRKATGVDGSQNGVGVRAGSQAFNKIAGLIFNNVTIDDYQKNGVIVDRSGSSATITNSWILGAGPLGSGFAAQNGVQITNNAIALIQGSTISGHVYTPATWAAVGVLTTDAGAVTIRNNNLAANSEGVYAYSAAGIASPLTIENNNFSGSDYGIVAWGVNADIRENLLTNNGIGIGVYPVNTGIVGMHSNDITGSTIAAIDVDNHGATPITGAQLSASFNRLGGNVSGLSNATSSNFNAKNNFWGCNAGPNGGVGCDSATGIFDADPWLTLTGMVATPTSVNTGGTSSVSGANLRMNSNNEDTFSFPGNPNVRDGISVTYTVNSFGSIDVASSTFVDGLAIAGTTFTAGGPFNGNQTAVVSATLDAATSGASITVLDVIAPTVTITANGPNPTNNTSITFTAVFSEAVTGFNTTGVSLAGTTAGGAMVASVTESGPMNGTTYTVTVTVDGSANGNVSATVNAGAANDNGSPANPNSASNTASVGYFAGSLELVVDDAGVNCLGNGAPVYLTIPDAVAAASPGYTIRVCSGTYAMTGNTPLNKAGMTIIAAEATKPTINVTGTGNLFTVGASNVTVDGLNFVKADTTAQHIFTVQGTNFTAQNGDFTSTTSWESTGTTRVFEVSSTATGLLIDNNTITDFRQPAYLNGSGTVMLGTVSNNTVTRTKGWAVDGAMVNFVGNNMHACAACDTDIALFASGATAAVQTFYADRLALSAANNNAHIDVQFTAADDSGRAISYVNAATGSDTNNGRADSPYKSIQQAIFMADSSPSVRIDSTLPGGTVNVAAGTYNPAGGQILVNRSLNVIGADPNTTVIDGLGVAPATTGLVRLDTPVADTGNTTFTGFTVTNPGGAGTKAAIFAKPMSPTSTVTINNIRIIGMGTTDYGLWAYRPRGPVVFTGNTVSGTGYNPVLIEQALGGSDVSGNTVQSPFGYFNMTYGGENIAALQKVVNNSFDNGSVSITSGIGGAAGKFSNIEVTGNTFLNLGAKTAIGITNQSADGVSGEITGAIVTGNRVSGTNATASNGVRLTGLITNANVSCNTLIRTENGVQVVSNAGGSPVGATVVDNNFGGNTFGINNTSANTVDGTGNFWGSASGPGPVGSGSGVQVSSLVTFSPYATAPVPCAPAMPPTVSLEQASGQNDPTNVASIDFTVTFNEDVVGFDAASDVLLGNANFGSITPINASTYTLTVTAIADGPVTASVVDGAATSIATSQPSIASTSADNSVTYDATSPTAVLTYNGVDPTNSTLNFSLVFSEAVTGFDLSDINVVNGTASNLAGSAGSYTFDVTASSNGNVVVDIAAGGAADAAGNTNAASNQITVAFDGSAPSVTILHSAATSNTSPVTFTVTFSEAVTGFDANDIVLSGSTTGGPLAATVSGTGPAYTVSVTGMSQNGDVVIGVPAGAAADNASNSNTASTPASPGSDTIAFTVDSTTKVITSANAVSEQWAYYDDVSNAVMPNYDLVYGPATPPLQSGSARLQTPAAGPTSLLAFGTTAFNGTRLDSITAYSYSAYLSSAGLGGGEPTLQFNVDYNLDDADTSYQGRIVYVPSQNGTVTPDSWQNWNALNGLFWGSPTFAPPGMPCTQFSPCTRAQLLSNYPNIGIHASAGFLLFRGEPNANANVDRLTIGVNSENTVFDFEPSFPAPTVSYAGPDPTNAGTINFAVTFDEPVTGFGDAASDVTLGGTAGATTAVVTGSGTTYNVAVSGMTGDGSIDVSVPASAAQGSSSSAPSTASNTASVNYDATGASVTVEQAVGQADPTSTSPINFTVVFDQPVTGFGVEAGDVVIGGTAGATTAVVTGSGSTYNVAVSGMNASGIVSITVPAGAAQDTLGNPSYASTSTDNTVQFDLSNNVVVVSPVNLNSWSRTLDAQNTTFVSGPSGGPKPDGSLRMVTVPHPPVFNGGKTSLTTQQHNNTKLSEITELRYSTYITSRQVGTSVAPALNLMIDLDGNGTRDTTMVYEPVYSVGSQGATQEGIWQHWDAKSGNWWFTTTTVFGSSQSAYPSYAAILAAYPNAQIVNGGGFGAGTQIVVGQNSAGSPWGGFDGNVDQLILGVNSSNTTYDFEATPPTLSVDDSTVVEGNAGTSQMTFTVSISEVSQLPTTVSVSTSDGTATVADHDYVAVTNQTVTIPAGDLSATFTVDVNGDVLHEADETFTVTLSNPANAVIADGTGTGTITNDEAALTVSISTVSTGTETGTPNTFAVTLSGSSAFPVSVDYQTSDGSATAGSDYTTVSGTILFPANTLSLTQQIVVASLNDTTPEPIETFTIDLSNVSGASIATGSAVGSIADNGGYISISGNIQQYNSPSPNTNLEGVTVTLQGTATQSTTTDANGNFVFSSGLPIGGNYLVTPECPSNPNCVGKVFDPNSRNFDTVLSNVSNANFIAYDPNAIAREVTAATVYGTPGTDVIVPVTVDSLGNETGFSFTVDYDTAYLPTVDLVECGADAGVGCFITLNTSTPGKLGVVVEPASTLVTGTREILRVTFSTASAVSGPNSPVSFSGTPTVQSTSDGDGNPLAAMYTSGLVIFARGWEGDIAGRFEGSGPNNATPAGVVNTGDVTVIRGMAAGNLTPNPMFNEFQRADAAPTATRGGGSINTGDITVIRNFAAGNQVPQTAGGPFAPISPLASTDEAKFLRGESDLGTVNAVVSVVNTNATPGTTVTVPIRVQFQGIEAGTQFSLDFDESKLSYQSVSLAPGLPPGTGLTLNVNNVGVGQIGIVIDQISPFPAGTYDIVLVTFNVAPTAPQGATPISFVNFPTGFFTNDGKGLEVPTTRVDGTVTIGGLAPTSAPTSVAGRVVGAKGQVVAGAVVQLTDPSGLVFSGRTNSFGNFRIDGVPTGRTYMVGARAKGLSFGTQAISVQDEIVGLTITALE